MSEQRASALSGYRILDLADEKGMLCSRLLTDMGAEVVRVEPSDSVNDSSLWENLGKRSITLDIEDAAGKEIFTKLIKAADALVESYAPGYLDALGLGYGELIKINPLLIMVSLTGFGQDGPYRHYHSSDMVASALSGQMYVCGDPDMPPLKPFGNQAYYSACLFAAIGVMLALQNLHATGRGQHIDISVQECAAATLDHVLVRYFYQGVVARRQGSLHWDGGLRIFPCRDGHILLSLFRQWETLVEWLDAEGMADDLTEMKWREAETRLQHLDHITEVLEKWTRSHTAAELVETGQLMGFPWAKVISLPELIGSPQLEERGFFVDAEHPDTGRKFRYPGAACRLSGSPWRIGERTPHRGESNREIYGELGLSPDEIDALSRRGVI